MILKENLNSEMEKGCHSIPDMRRDCKRVITGRLTIKTYTETITRTHISTFSQWACHYLMSPQFDLGNIKLCHLQ